MEAAFTKVLSDPVLFAETFFNFHPTEYQAKLLRDDSKRIVVRWSRQAGKTTTVALRAIWYALSNRKTLTLVVAPSLRQSMIMGDHIQDYLTTLPKRWFDLFVDKMQRTIIRFKTQSRIVILPNSPQLLRGYAAHQVICLPQYVRILSADGTEVPIDQVRPGEVVLSYNVRKNCIEPRRVVKTFRRRYNGPLININHEFGNLQCTPNHEVYTLSGKIAASCLNKTDQILCASGCLARRQTSELPSKAISLWRAARRLLHFKTAEEQTELQSKDTTWIVPSRLRYVQIFSPERLCPNASKNSREPWMGERVNSLRHPSIPSFHASVQNLLQERTKNSESRMAQKDLQSASPRCVVYGRRKLGQEWNNEHKHPQFLTGGAFATDGMAREEVECPSASRRRYERKRVLSPFSVRRKRQIPVISKNVCYSEHELQAYGGCPHFILPCLWSELCTEEKCLWNCKGSKLESLLQSKMSQVCGAEEAIQSAASTMQGLQENLRTSHWKPSDVQSILQPRIPSDEEENKRSALQTAKEIEVFNIEVEGNHNYYANRVLVANCDEAAFFREDDLVFYNVLYPMLATTDGVLIASSTPWSKDSVFYRMCMSEEFSKHTITWQDVVKAGLIKREFIDEMRAQLPDERFEREFNAQFVEDVDAWLPQSLIVSCIDSQLEPLEFQAEISNAHLYLGVDFGKHQNYSVLAALEKTDKSFRLVHLHRFPLKTEYASVIGYVKSLQDRWCLVRSVYADITGVGDYIVEDMTRSGITNVTGVSFTVASKEEIATILREKMRGGEVKIPYTPARTASDVDLTAELNVEKFELLKTGHIKFTHPEGSHDDVFWATALAVYAAAKHPVVRGLVDFGTVGDKK